MISTITIQSVRGILQLVQTIVYPNGKQVKRVLDPITRIPVEILD